MDSSQAQNTVLAVVIVAGAVVVWDNIKKTGKASPGGKSLVALAIVAAGLMIGAQVAPSIAGYLAILIGLGVVISRVGVKKA